MAETHGGRGRVCRRSRGRGVDAEEDELPNLRQDQRDREITARRRRIRELERQLAEARTATANEEGEEESASLSSSSTGDDDEGFYRWGIPNQRNRRPGLKPDVSYQTLGMEIDLPEFEGISHPDEFIDWLRTVERVFDVKNLNDSQKVKLVAIKLRKHASIWWEHVKTKRVREGKPKIRSWSKMKEKLIAKFLPTQHRQEASVEYHNLKHRGMSVEQYANESDVLRMRCDVVEEDVAPVYDDYGDYDEGLGDHLTEGEEITCVDSGESSVLESLAGISLPRGQDIFTRVPLVMRLQNDPNITAPHLQLEYTLQELRNCDQPEQEKLSEPVQDYDVKPGTDVYTDVLCLYNNLLLSFAESDELNLAVRTVLDSKRFLKEWPFHDDPDDNLLRFICRILPSSTGLEAVFTKGYPPGEVVGVPLHSTIGDLKIAIESAMRDIYCIMDNLMITDIVGMDVPHGSPTNLALSGILSDWPGETLTEFLSKATGIAVDWVPMPGMKPGPDSVGIFAISHSGSGVAARACGLVSLEPTKIAEVLKDRPSWFRDCWNVKVFTIFSAGSGGTVEFLLIPSGYLIRLYDGGGSIIHIVSGLKILDTGDLVLQDISNQTVWQSFDHPTGALLPGQKLRAVNEIEPALKNQLIISTALLTVGIAIVSWTCLPSSFTIFNFGTQKVVKNWELFLCVAVDLWDGLIIGFITEYYTSNAYSPVQDVADSCRTGAATNVIFGLALGYKSIISPIFAIGSAALVSLALFGAFVSWAAISAVDVLTPQVFIGLIVGAMLPYWFSAMTMKSVGNAASGEEFRVGAGLADPYATTWCAVEYFEASGSILQMLLQRLVPSTSHNGRTLLHHAILCGNAGAVSVLLKCGAYAESPVKTTRKIELRPIHMAARLGFSSVLKCLIDFGCDVDARTDTGDTSLMITAGFKREDCLKVLTRAGADFGLVNVAGESASSIAASNRWKLDFQGAVLEVIQSGKVPKSSDMSVFSPLLFVARSRDFLSLKTLIGQGEIDLDSQDDQGFSAVMITAAEGHVDGFRLLVYAGANVKLQNTSGETAVTLCALNQNRDRFEKVLLDFALEQGSRSTAGFYALHCAARCGDLDAVKLLTTRGYDVNMSNGDGYTPLMLAAREGHGRTCEFLIACGARCDIKNAMGEAALSLARKMQKDKAERVILDELARKLGGADLFQSI